jgi:hypothetical protein
MAQSQSSAETSAPFHLVVDNTVSKPPQFDFSDGGGGGGSTVDTETQRYVDKSMDTVKAQNDARFAEVLARIDVMTETLREKPSTITTVGIGVGGILAIVTIWAFASGSFGNGITAASFQIQSDRNADQIKSLVSHADQTDAKLDKLIEAVTAIQPKY